MQQINFGDLRYCLNIIKAYNNDEVTVDKNVMSHLDNQNSVCIEFSRYLWEEKNELFSRLLKSKVPSVNLKEEIIEALKNKFGDVSIEINYPNIIWYPGSAYASEAWAKYLQNTFKGQWFYSDMNNFTEWLNLPGKRLIINTLDPLPNEILRQEIDTLIISSHSGLKTFEEIIQSGILTSIAPQKFIYDPGTSRIGDIEQHLNEIDLFKEQGYILDKIVVLPHLKHQYCDFHKV